MFGESKTLLTSACGRQDISVIKLLMKYGADPNINNCFEQSYGEAKALIRGHFRAYKKKLCKYFANDNIEKVEEILKSGKILNINQKDESGNTLLHKACAGDKLGFILLFLEYGASKEAQNKEDKKPFELLCGKARNYFEEKTLPPIDHLINCVLRNELAEVSKIVNLKQIAHINQKDEFGFTVLHLVCARGWNEIAQKLIDKGAEVNAEDKSKATPLYLACQNGLLEMVKLLNNNGASLNVKKYSYMSGWNTPLLVAYDYVRINSINKDDKEQKEKYLDIVKYLIEAGADLNLADHHGNNIFHNSCRDNEIELSVILFKKGCNPYKKNEWEQTPLELAKKSKRSEFVDFKLVYVPQQETFKILQQLIDCSEIKDNGGTENPLLGEHENFGN